MKFEWALQKMREGGKVRRPSWHANSYCRCILNDSDEFDSLRVAWDGTESQFLITGEDIFADDWEPYHDGEDFSWALERMKEGKAVRRIGNDEALYAHRKSMIMNFRNGIWDYSLMSSEDLLANDWVLEECVS